MTHALLEVQRSFDLMIRNKSAIQLRVPHLLSFIDGDLVLNLHIVLLVRASVGIKLADNGHDAH